MAGVSEWSEWSESSSSDGSSTEESGESDSDIDKDWLSGLKTFSLQLHPELLNLMNEFADAEMFLIDGDSLLVEMLMNQNLDWSHGGQFLHLVYLCERYLDLFQRKGGVFEIVFFQNYQQLWRGMPSLSLARQVLKIHLSENIKNKVLCGFPHPWDKNFAKYVKQFGPSFILLSDGLVSKRATIPEIFSKVFLCQLNKCLKMDINCAFTSGIEFCTSSLNGYHVMASGRRSCSLLEEDEILKDIGSYNNTPTSNQFNKQVLDEIMKVSDGLQPEYQDGRFLLYVVAASFYLIKNSDVARHQDLVRVVLLHAVLLTEIPLSYRALSLHHHLDKESDRQRDFMECFTEFQGFMCDFLEFIPNLPSKSCQLNWSNVGSCDVWDGRLVFVLLDVLFKKKQRNVDISLSESTRSKFVAVVNSVSSLAKIKINPFPVLQSLVYEEQEFQNFPVAAENLETMTTSSSVGLIRMDCPLLNEYAGEIIDTPSVRQREQDEPDIAKLVVSGNDFDEIYHWHSGKPLTDDYERTRENRTEENKKRAMRNQSKYALFMQRYGESLQGEGCGKPIIVENNAKDGKNGKNKKTSGKALAIIEENKNKKKLEREKKEEGLWQQQERQLKRLLVAEEFEKAIYIVENIIESSSLGDVKIKALLTKAKIFWKKWQISCQSTRSTEKKNSHSDVNACFLTIRELVEDFGGSLKAEQKEEVAAYLEGFGFDDIAVKTKMTKKSRSEARTSVSEYSLNVSSSRFQLQRIGHHLKRETRVDKDPRVDGFIPESWQRKLLDAVDNKQSALIVAPTSSGKTYASFYCMEKVLKEDNDGVVVYVSPTKALVNQVAATCYARFHKKTMPPGKSVYGVFTRDYRTNALNSQILVTVPQCLEVLLLSPARQDWVAKMKYVILDEVHCIGSEIGAEYWEHLLLLIRCPFLALSATIRNPEELHNWLQNAEFQKREVNKKTKAVRGRSAKSYEVALVTHNQRHNDLEKYEFVSNSSKKKTQGSGNKSANIASVQHVHPCSMLKYHQLVHCEGIFPNHISLSPREALALYDAMVKCCPKKAALQDLCPEKYFEEKAFISKQDARKYEDDLKREFMTWTSERNLLEKVISSLQGEIPAAKCLPHDVSYVMDNLSLLLGILEKSDKLPVIFFSFDRQLCEGLALETIEYLEWKESKIKAKKLPLAKTEEKLEQKKAKIEKRLRDQPDEDDQTWKAKERKKCFLFDDPPEKGCSFALPGVLDDEDAEVIMSRLPDGNKSLLFQGIRRGVAYHHAGLGAKERRVVEMLFRKKFLRVVFATGTLALGIHMPCKTVVFAGDSVFLNSLQFHQISGRAGRRGFDLLGNVIFFGVPEAKIQRLMTVSLPRIIGNFPLNVTLVLRLLLLVNKGDGTHTTMNQVLTLLQNPLICQYQPTLEIQLKHHFLFSTEMLVRQGLLDVKGNPQGLAGLATHLHYHEPANLVFVSFLQQGLFHKFCKGQRSKGKFSKDFLKSLAVVLSHLFAIRKLHPFIMKQPRSTSKVVLEKLPKQFQKALEKYNSDVHDVFDLYLRTVAVHIYDTMGDDVTLPLSNVQFISAKDYQANATSEGDDLCEELRAISSPVKACSAFAALSGNTDNQLYSTEDLISNIRYQVYTDIKVVPILPRNPGTMLNAYAVDFFNHGNKVAIMNENCLKSGDSYNLLKDFLLVIKSIYVSLTELAPKDDVIVAAFSQLSEEYNSVFNSAFGWSPF